MLAHWTGVLLARRAPRGEHAGLLAALGLTQAQLTQPDAHIGHEAACTLWERLTHDAPSDFGARFSEELPLASLADWHDRVVAIGHGQPIGMDAAEALEVAAAAEPNTVASVDADPSGLKPDMEVIVTPDDTGRDPVRGRLLSADAQELVIRSAHPRVGEINLHFPRAGFDVVRADV